MGGSLRLWASEEKRLNGTNTLFSSANHQNHRKITRSLEDTGCKSSVFRNTAEHSGQHDDLKKQERSGKSLVMGHLI